MMKVRHLVLFSLVGLLIHVGSTIAATQPHSATPTPSAMDAEPLNQVPAPPWARDLQLNAQQRSQLQTIEQHARQKGEQLHQQLIAAEKQLRSLLQSQASIQQLRQQYQTVQQLRQQLDDNYFDTLLAERQVLTSEQLETVLQRFRPAPAAP